MNPTTVEMTDRFPTYPASLETAARPAWERFVPTTAEASARFGYAALRLAIRHHPETARTYFDPKSMSEAEFYFRHALTLDADCLDALHGLGAVTKWTGRTDEAFSTLLAAIRLRPDDERVIELLKTFVENERRAEKVLEVIGHAMHLNPGSEAIREAHCLALMRSGRWKEGFRGIAQCSWTGTSTRWPGFAGRDYPQPTWDGSPLDGRRIFLYDGPAGLGDLIQWARYAKLVQQRGGHVILEAPRRMWRLLSRCPGIDEMSDRGQAPPPFDVHEKLCALPVLFGTTMENVPADIPYLFAESGRVEYWRQELSRYPRLRVGICWHGSPGTSYTPRAIPLIDFAPLAELDGVTLFSLQQGDGHDELQRVPFAEHVIDLGPRLDADASFVDTAAVMKNLDLIISADTSIVHLAGALGVPVWTALPKYPDHRWVLGRTDTPWYPTMRLYRQTLLWEWADVFERITKDLATYSKGDHS